MLPRTSPTKASAGLAIIGAGRRSPTEGERPTTGSDEGNPSRRVLWNSRPVLSNPKSAPTKVGEVHCDPISRLQFERKHVYIQRSYFQ